MSNINWYYDDETGHYIAKGVRILFPNFAGEQQNFNPAGKRNFRLCMDEELASEMKNRGIYIRELPPREDGDETEYLMKVGVYPNSEVCLKSKKGLTQVLADEFGLIDSEFRRGHVRNGAIDVEFHVSKNTKVSNGALYVRLDAITIPVRKNKLMEEYEESIENGESSDDDELPF